jgi:uncharacterized repeat protein (TIGR01451 family)
MRARHWTVWMYRLAIVAGISVAPLAWAAPPRFTVNDRGTSVPPRRLSDSKNDLRSPKSEEPTPAEEQGDDNVRLAAGDDDPPEFTGPAKASKPSKPAAKPEAEAASAKNSSRRKPARSIQPGLLPKDDETAKPATPPAKSTTSTRKSLSSVLKKDEAGDVEGESGTDEAPTTQSAPRSRAGMSITGKGGSTPVTSAVLNGNRLAQLAVDVIGPQALTIGKPGQYVVRLSNNSDVSGKEVEVAIALPKSVQLVSGEGTVGEARQVEGEFGKQMLVWTINEVPGKAVEQMTVTLVPRDAQPVELGVDFKQKSAALATEITIREPQLEVRIEGPGDLKFGDEKGFALIIANPGTGDAEACSVEVAAGDMAPQKIELGLIPAGEQKQVPFQVAARAAGEMEIKAVAVGDGNLSAAAASRIIVHRAALQVAVSAPTYKYANSEIVYQVAVANNGDANAEGCVMTVALPSGSKYVGGVDGATPTGNTLTWKVGTLQPDSEKVFQVRCLVQQTGENRFEAAVRASDDLAAAEQTVTRVEALADLKLNVTDPSGPTPVGTEASYEIRVVNRGSKSAEKVRVLVQFADGIEPDSASGAQHELVNGQVVYDVIPTLAAGKELSFRVKCKVVKDGNHAYRVEVTSGDPESRLVTEGITRAFADAAAVAERPSARKGTSGGSAPPRKLR